MQKDKAKKILKELFFLIIGLLIILVIVTFVKKMQVSDVQDHAPVTPHDNSTRTVPVVLVSTPIFHYIQIIDGCGPYYNRGKCVNMRSGPGTTYPVVTRLRTGLVLKVASTTTEGDGYLWYKILFTTRLLYPERVTGELYVAADPASVTLFENEGDQFLTARTTSTKKLIVVDLSEEMLYAYDGDTLFMKESVSTGLELTPTPKGNFTVFKKMPSRYMQGPILTVSDQYYDLPGVPWNLYFSVDGAVIHGAYWHDKFGQPWSHGCVNLSPEKAKKLYVWADVGTPVRVKY